MAMYFHILFHFAVQSTWAAVASFMTSALCTFRGHKKARTSCVECRLCERNSQMSLLILISCAYIWNLTIDTTLLLKIKSNLIVFGLPTWVLSCDSYVVAECEWRYSCIVFGLPWKLTYRNLGKEFILKGVGEVSSVYECFHRRCTYDKQQWLKCIRSVCVSWDGGGDDWNSVMKENIFLWLLQLI